MLKSYVLISDGGRARLLQQSEDGSLHEMESWDHKKGRREPHELETDRAGQGMPGHTFEHEDPQRHAQQRFAHHLAGTLKLRLNEYDNLVVVAPPKMLGMLRHEFDKEVHQKVHTEIGHDWTHLSLHEVQPLLQKAVLSQA